jgi:hypothetical protein
LTSGPCPEVAMLPLTVLAVLAVFVIAAFVVARVDGLAFLGPRRTHALSDSAGVFCLEHCQTAGGECPLAATGMVPAECPLWRFIDADLRTEPYGNPFAQLRLAKT